MRYLRFIPIILTVTGTSLLAADSTASNPETKHTDRPWDLPPSAGISTLTNTEAQFVEQAAENNRREVQLAKRALRQSSNDKIVDLAQHVIKDQVSTTQKLEDLGRGNGLTMETTLGPVNAPPMNISAESRANRDGTSGAVTKDPDSTTIESDHIFDLEGPDFDAEFVKQTIDVHQAEIAKFETLQQTANNHHLQKLVSASLPKLRDHLEEAQKLNK